MKLPASQSLHSLIVVFVCSVCPLSLAAQAVHPPLTSLQAFRPRICAPVSYSDDHEDQPSGSRFPLMTDRYTWLTEVQNGWQRTRVPLVGYANGKLVPIPCADDTGLFYVVPVIARLGNGSLDKAIDIFFFSLIGVAFLIGAFGIWINTRGIWLRGLGLIAASAIALLALKVGDVYSLQAVAVLAVVPWSLYFLRTRIDSRWRYLFLVIAGLFLGFVQWIRTHAATLLLVFLLVLIAGASLQWTRKFVFAAVLLIAFAMPLLCARLLVYQRDQYLSRVDVGYRPDPPHHPFWHSLYIGLGYLRNPYVPGYFDIVGTSAVAQTAPQVIYGSQEYEEILRGRILEILRKDHYFFLYTYAAKFGVILLILLLSTNLGLIAAMLYPKPLPVELSFWAAMAFGALPGIIAIPVPQYLTGMISLGILYSYVSVCHAASCFQKRGNNLSGRSADLRCLREELVSKAG